MKMNADFLFRGFVLYSMFRYSSCLESYWEEVTSLRNYLPDSDFSATKAANIFALKDDGCPLGWYIIESSCFFFADVKLSWQDSVTYCQVLGARLAELDSEPKDAFLRSKAITRTHIRRNWLGGSDIVKEGTWVWATSGSLMTNYTNWYIDQPDNVGGGQLDADCLCIGRWRQYTTWDDCACFELGSPVCEKPDLHV